jgi:hypothetical protein
LYTLGTREAVGLPWKSRPTASEPNPSQRGIETCKQYRKVPRRATPYALRSPPEQSQRWEEGGWSGWRVEEDIIEALDRQGITVPVVVELDTGAVAEDVCWQIHRSLTVQVSVA